MKTQTIIPGPATEEHAKLIRQYTQATEQERGGLMRRCVLLEIIRKKKTYKAVAPTFEEFCERSLGVKASNGYLMASAGPTCAKILEAQKEKNSAIAEFRLEWFKPIAAIGNPITQFSCPGAVRETRNSRVRINRRTASTRDLRPRIFLASRRIDPFSMFELLAAYFVTRQSRPWYHRGIEARSFHRGYILEYTRVELIRRPP